MELTQRTHKYGYIQEDKIFLKGFLDFKDRQIGMVKESEEASLKYFDDRFEIARQKVVTLATLIEEAQNKGSYLMKLVHMRKYLANFDGLGDYVLLFAQLDELEKRLRATISVNRIRNLEIKEALIREAEALLDAEDMAAAADLIKETKQKWIKTGAVVKEKQDQLEQKFQEVYAEFFIRRKQAIKDKTRQARHNLRFFQNILDRADYIKNSDNFEKTFQDFRDLQQAWKKGGKIPHKKAIMFWERFRQANDFFFARYKNFKALKPEYPDLTSVEIKKKLESELSEEAVKIAAEDAHLYTERAKELLMEWKKLTSVFRNLDRECANQFRISCDRIFEESYLMRVVKRKYPLFESKPLEDRLRIKTSFMRELIRRDEEELLLNEAELEKEINKNNLKNKKLLQNKHNIQKRKIEVKKIILGELEEQLTELRN
ncbi:MAG: DUF349 domain-containing protein [Microscillaceae bacterium]|nr:DUF349 domain-containing protein [Microscillaceae bacterium]